MFGMCLTSYSGGAMLEHMDKRLLFFITASFPCVVFAASWFFPESPLGKKSDFIASFHNHSNYQSINNDEHEKLVNMENKNNSSNQN